MYHRFVYSLFVSSRFVIVQLSSRLKSGSFENFRENLAQILQVADLVLGHWLGRRFRIGLDQMRTLPSVLHGSSCIQSRVI